MFYMRDIGWGWEFLMAIGMVAFWVLVVLAVVWLVRSGSAPSSPATGPEDRPIDILDRRLASGDLTLEEYQERREAIETDRVKAGARVSPGGGR